MVFADTLESVDEVSVRVFLLSMPVAQGLKIKWTKWMIAR